MPWSGIEANSQVSKNKMFQEIPWRIHAILHGKISYSHYGRLYYLLFINLQARRNSQKIKSWMHIALSLVAHGKESICQCGKHGFDPRVRKIPWRRKWQPPQVFLPGKSHRQRSLAGYSPTVRGHDLVTKQEQHHQQQIHCPVRFLYMGELYCLYP